MGFKIGIGLLLLGIILANGTCFNLGWLFWLVACLLGFIGVILICASRNSNNKQ